MQTEERIILAGELALGLLDSQEEVHALGLLRRDPDFAREVGVWEDRFAVTLESIPEETPHRSVLNSVEDALFGSQRTRPAVRPFPWGKLVIGVVAVKAGLLGSWLAVREAALEKFTVETRYGASVLNWNSRTGQLQLTGSGMDKLNLWARSSKGFTYLGRGGELLSSGLATGAVIVVSDDRPGSADPEVLIQIELQPQ